MFLVMKSRGRVEVSLAEGDGFAFRNSLYARDL
jgi:hypothetical protein